MFIVYGLCKKLSYSQYNHKTHEKCTAARTAPPAPCTFTRVELLVLTNIYSSTRLLTSITVEKTAGTDYFHY